MLEARQFTKIYFDACHTRTCLRAPFRRVAASGDTWSRDQQWLGSRTPWARVRTGKITEYVGLSAGYSENVILPGIRSWAKSSLSLSLLEVTPVSHRCHIPIALSPHVNQSRIVYGGSARKYFYVANSFLDPSSSSSLIRSSARETREGHKSQRPSHSTGTILPTQQESMA